MGRTLTTILGVVCSLALAGCSSDSVSGPSETTPTPSTTSTPPSSTASASASVSVPTTSAPTSTGQEPRLQPPKLPELAKEKSPGGAKAFVKYYIEAVNYAWLTHSTELLKTLSTDRCIQCTDIAEGIDDIKRQNGETTGALWRPKALVLIPFQSEEAPLVNVAITTSRGRWKPSAAAGWMTIQPSINHWDMQLNRNGDHWVIASAEVQ